MRGQTPSATGNGCAVASGGASGSYVQVAVRGLTPLAYGNTRVALVVSTYTMAS